MRMCVSPGVGEKKIQIKNLFPGLILIFFPHLGINAYTEPQLAQDLPINNLKIGVSTKLISTARIRGNVLLKKNLKKKF